MYAQLIMSSKLTLVAVPYIDELYEKAKQRRSDYNGATKFEQLIERCKAHQKEGYYGVMYWSMTTHMHKAENKLLSNKYIGKENKHKSSNKSDKKENGCVYIIYPNLSQSRSRNRSRSRSRIRSRSRSR
eukprot:318758_1